MESGTKVFRTRFPLLSRKIFDAEYYKLYPVFARFVIPGDVWKINCNALIRYQPMLSPSLTPCQARVRFFFVPLRLLSDKTEFIITGSEDGYFNKDKEVPAFDAWICNDPTVAKGSLAETMLGLPVGTDIDDLAVEESAPADYWRKAYYRCWWDYYRDENLSTASAKGDFESWLSDASSLTEDYGGSLMSVCLPHDYFTKSLPWQLKGIAPAMSFDVSGLAWQGFGTNSHPDDTLSASLSVVGFGADETDSASKGLAYPAGTWTSSGANASDVSKNIQAFLNNIKGDVNGAFTMADLRDLSAQTRVFERLARCGSRYTEYLRANFATSPADETLQRAQYLGGVKIPIVVTEVPQVAGAVNSSDQQTPVGTMRGKGISAGAGSIKSCHFKEFGVLLGLFDCRPALQYCQGLPREFTYKKRFDFFNPSFQHLSEQEVRKSELFCDPSDHKDDETFGFQAYANELRTGYTSIVGNMRDNLNYWHQGLIFASRPSLNDAFITGTNHSLFLFIASAPIGNENIITSFVPECESIFTDGQPIQVYHNEPSAYELHKGKPCQR